MIPQGQEIRSFTGLRGIAALYVMMYHYKAYNLFGETAAPFFLHGYLAVDLFFVLSGFVMALTYQSLFVGSFNIQSFKTFLSRRIARVYPLYLAITLIFLAIYTLFPNKTPEDVDTSATAIAANLMMVQAWGFKASILGPGWSISTEWAAYLLFPALISLSLFRSSLIAWLSGCVSIAIMCGLTYVSAEALNHGPMRGPLDVWDGRSIGPILRCIAEFNLGIITYRLAKATHEPSSFLYKLSLSPLLSSGLFVTLLVLLAIPQSDLLVVLLVPFLIFALTPDTSPIAKLLGNGPIYGLGVISYSLYLIHPAIFWIRKPIIYVLDFVGLGESQIALTFVMIGAAITLGTLTYMLIEKPGRSLLRHLSERKTQT